MRVVVIGGTGLIGHEAARALRERGHEVVLLARSAPTTPLPGLADTPVARGDVGALTDAELSTALGGFDAVVYSLGPDDREHTTEEATAYFQRMLVERTERVCRVARSAGVRRMVVVGSYFTAWQREHPELGFAARHAYAQARVDQASRAIAAGGGARAGGTDVCVLEIPYVFGVVPGQVPLWKTWLFDRVRAMRGAVLYPRGGSTVVTSRVCGLAGAAAVERGEHGRHYPVGSADLTWTRLLRLVLDEMGRPRTPVVTVPRRLAEPSARSMARALRRDGLHSGIDPAWLMRDLMYRELFVDWRTSAIDLGYAAGGLPEVRAAVAETVRAAYGRA